MKIRLIITTAAILALSGCVTKKQVDEQSASLALIQGSVDSLSLQINQLQEQQKELQQKLSPQTCTLGGNEYSEGAVVQGRICEDLTMYRKPGQPPRMGWKLYNYKH